MSYFLKDISDGLIFCHADVKQALSRQILFIEDDPIAFERILVLDSPEDLIEQITWHVGITLINLLDWKFGYENHYSLEDQSHDIKDLVETNLAVVDMDQNTIEKIDGKELIRNALSIIMDRKLPDVYYRENNDFGIHYQFIQDFFSGVEVSNKVYIIDNEWIKSDLDSPSSMVMSQDEFMILKLSTEGSFSERFEVLGNDYIKEWKKLLPAFLVNEIPNKSEDT